MTFLSIILIAAGLMMLCERARPWPAVAGWWLRAGLLNGVQIGAVYLAGVTWDRWFAAWRPPWSADGLGVLGGAVVGYAVITFVYYWWHRWRHESPLLWRWFHQVHHSAQRIEVLTSFYKHPLEILANGVLSSAILYLVVGVGPEAAALAVLFTALAELFYHWNVRTPFALGYLVQRPEAHCLHHQEGVHAHNYADLPLWDMAFGTFRNPPVWQGRCGFGAEAEPRLAEMLVGIDLSSACSEANASRGASKPQPVPRSSR
jgi:sterol desaturase/sphingolipid hydroxylase (fatty acid hydroxylase superfamily)